MSWQLTALQSDQSLIINMQSLYRLGERAQDTIKIAQHRLPLTDKVMSSGK